MKQRYSKKQSCLFFSLLSLSILSATFVNASMAPQDLRQTILILDRARNNGIVEFRAGTSAGTLSEVEKKEFRTFLNYLGRRIYFYCGELENAVPPVSTDELPCNYQETNIQQMQESLPPSPSQTTTTSEEISELDSSLSSALGQFDEMLLRENEQIASQRSSAGQRETQSEGQESGSTGSTGSAGNSGSNGKQTQTSKQASQSDTVAGGAGEGSQDTRTTPRQDQQGIHEDDDIVARQLREAAEKETDLEIKEKLWEEYRRYKEGT